MTRLHPIPKPAALRAAPPHLPEAGEIIPGRAARLGARLGALLTTHTGPEAPWAVLHHEVGLAGRVCGLEVTLHAPKLGWTFPLVLEPGLLLDPPHLPDLPAPSIGPHPPGRLARSRMLLSLLDLLAEIAGHGGPHLHLQARAEATASAALRLHVRRGPATGLVELALTDPLLDALEALPLARPRTLPRAQVHLDLDLAVLSLSYPTLERLRPGDLLLPGAEHRLEGAWPQGPVVLRLGGGRVAGGQLSPEGFVLETTEPSTPLPLEEPVMSSTLLDAVCVDLRLRLCTLSVDLETLSALGPGVALPLPEGPPRVDLLVGERPIGRGELVDLDGALAVKITSRRA
jgi:flagellar motor switch/type III secretory pathway protein FliN